MRNLVWLDSAVNDLVRLKNFIAEKNPLAAYRAAESIQEAAQALITTPSIGKSIPSLPSYRDLFMRFGSGGYVLRYRTYLENIYIVHVRHYREKDFKAR